MQVGRRLGGPGLWAPVPGMRKAAAAPSEAEILGGWVLAKEYGRVDEDVTFSDFTWFFATSEAVVHLRQYQETLH